jgi:hypothetical protein
MAADLGDLTAKIGADNKDYIAAMAASKAAVADFARANDLSLGEASSVLRAWSSDQKSQLAAAQRSVEEYNRMVEKGMKDGAKAVKDYNKDWTAALKDNQARTNETWESIGSGAAAMAAMVVAAMAAAVAGMVAFGDQAIDAANLMDPRGADEWYASVQRLKDAWVTFSGTIGKELRPELEKLMDEMVKLIHFMDTVDFSKIGSDVEDLAHKFMLLVSPVQTLSAMFGEMTGKAIGGSEAFQKMAGEAAGAIEKHYQAAGKEGSPGPSADQHYKDAAEIRAAGAAHLRELREEGKEERERAQVAGANFAKATQAAEVEKEAAKTAYDLSNKTLGDKAAMLKLQQAADEKTGQAAATNLAAAKAVMDAFTSKHNETKEKAAFEQANKVLENPAGKSPEALARASVTQKDFLFEQQNRMKMMADVAKAQAEVDKSHLQSTKDADAIQVNTFEKDRQSAKDSADAQMQAAQHAYEMSNKTITDDMALLEAKKAFAVDDAKRASDKDAADLKILQAKQAFAERMHAEDDKRQATGEGVAKAALGPAGGAVDVGKALATGADPITALISFVAQMLMASSSFKMLTTALAPLIQLVSDLLGLIDLLYLGLLPVIAILDVINPVLTFFSAAISDVLNLVLLPFQLLGSILGAILAPLQAFMDFFTSGITDVIMAPFKVLGDIFNAIVAPVKAFGDAIKTMADDVIMAPFKGLADIGKAIEAPLQQFSTVLQQFIGGPAAAVTLGLTQLGKLFGYLSESFSRAAQVFDPVRSIVETLVQALGASFGPIIGKLGNGMQMVANILQAALVPVLPLLEQALQSLANGIAGPLGDAIGTIYNSGFQIAAFVSHSAGALSLTFSSVLGQLSAWVTDIDTALKSSALKPLGDALYNSAIALQTAGNDLNTAGDAFAQVTWKATSSVIALAVAADAANTQLTNLPASFNVAEAYNQAIAAGAIGSGGTNNQSQSGLSILGSVMEVMSTLSLTAANGTDPNTALGATNPSAGHDPNHRDFRTNRGGDGGTTIYIENLTVEASNPMDLFDDLANLNSAQGNGSTMAPSSRPARQELAYR